MKKSGFTRVAFVPLIGAALLAGCVSGGPNRPAGEVIKEGIVNLFGSPVFSYDAAVNGDITDTSDANVKFDLNVKGQLDASSENELKLIAKGNGSLSNSSGVGGSTTAEIRLDGDNVYFNVADLKLDGEGSELPKEVTDLFGKWWKYSLPDGLLEDNGVSLSPAGEDEKTKMNASLDKVLVFAKPEYVGTDDVMGEASYHYRFTVDKKGLVEYLRKSSEEQGQTVSDEDSAKALEQFNKEDIAAEVWIGSGSKVITRFKGSLNMKGTEPGEGKGSMSADVSFGSFGKAFSIEAPAGTAEFPLDTLLGAMMGGSMTPPTDEDMMIDGDDALGNGSGL